MKLNWGKGIVIGMVIFMAFIVTLVVAMMNQKIDLVAKDYYEQGIDFERQMEDTRAAAALIGKAHCQVNYNSRQLQVFFPADFEGKKTTGKILLFRPSDAGKDISIDLLLDSNLQQNIPLDKLSKGNWRVKLQWQCDGKNYYHEEAITI